MRYSIKKILVLLPVIVISLVYLSALYKSNYSGASLKRVTGLVVTVLILYAWFIIITARRKQDNFFEGLVQSSFFVYVFAVLTLTGYFILFKEVSSHDWWHKMMLRMERKDHVNLEFFKTIRRYKIVDKQVAGNFLMLLPLGIYLPLLYTRLRKPLSFFPVVFICFLVSVEIEILQLATSYRSTDVDDVALNTLGGCTGFIIYRMIRLIVNKTSKKD